MVLWKSDTPQATDCLRPQVDGVGWRGRALQQSDTGRYPLKVAKNGNQKQAPPASHREAACPGPHPLPSSGNHS